MEIQIRTELQHQWAELSEKLSDVIDPAIKYGAGHKPALSLLSKLTELIETVETIEAGIGEGAEMPSKFDDEQKSRLEILREQLPLAKQGVTDLLQDTIAQLEAVRESK